MIKLWIDTESGTWGDINNLRLLDTERDISHLSDVERSNFGRTEGYPVLSYNPKTWEVNNSIKQPDISAFKALFWIVYLALLVVGTTTGLVLWLRWLF